jgi:hypothetical protein
MIKKFLGLFIDSTLFWKLQTEQLYKLNVAIRSDVLKPPCLRKYWKWFKIPTFTVLCYLEQNSWEKSTDSTKISKNEKRLNWIITRSKNRDAYRDLFKNIKSSPFHSQRTLSLILVVVHCKGMYNLNSDIHNKNMRQQFNFQQHSANLYLILKEYTPSALKCSIVSPNV